jgi:glycosyltransferase involved in cell wall biosynthesis
MPSPTIAMLVPAFNAAACLPRLLVSAGRQTEPFDEIWVYDDCSTDDTAAVAERNGARVVRGELNRGCSHAKNVLAACTTVDWIHFHDADDDLKPDFVALARRWARDGRHDVVLFAYEECDDSTGELMAVRRFAGADLARDARSYAIRKQINPFCGLYRRERFLAAGGYDEESLVLYNEDVAMHIGLAFAGLSFGAEPEVSIVNRRRGDSMSAANRLKCLRAQFHVMRRTANREGGSQYAVEISHRLWQIAEGLAAELDWHTADQAVKLATELAGLDGLPAGRAFKMLNLVSPKLAIRTREWIIRAAKPRLRIGYRGWRLGV